MRRGSRITTTVLSVVAVVALGAGGAFGVLRLGDLAEDEDTPRTAVPRHRVVTEKSPGETVTKESGSVAERGPLLERGDRGRRVREVQHRLFQVAWYSHRSAAPSTARRPGRSAGSSASVASTSRAR